VAAAGGFADEVREARADPAKKEAGHLYLAIAEEIEEAIEVALDPRR
jgi:hypothetical protein